MRRDHPIETPGNITEELFLEFEVSLFEAVLKRDPGNAEALLALGNAYTRRGQYEAGLEVDRKLVELLPTDSTAHYNLACSYSLLGDLDEAIEELRAAIEYGYDDHEFMMTDPDLENVRRDRRFEDLCDLIENWETS